jgi:hypothetical protein
MTPQALVNAKQDRSMPDRFLRSRWSATRLAIHDMAPGETIKFPADQYFNCNASVPRLNDAYAGERQWTIKNRTEVTRTL